MPISLLYFQEKKTTFYSDPTKAEQQQENGHQGNGHQSNGQKQPVGSMAKRPFDHEKAANGIETSDQRDATIVGLGFNNPNYSMSSNTDESKT